MSRQSLSKQDAVIADLQTQITALRAQSRRGFHVPCAMAWKDATALQEEGRLGSFTLSRCSLRCQPQAFWLSVLLRLWGSSGILCGANQPKGSICGSVANSIGLTHVAFDDWEFHGLFFEGFHVRNRLPTAQFFVSLWCSPKELLSMTGLRSSSISPANALASYLNQLSELREQRRLETQEQRLAWLPTYRAMHPICWALLGIFFPGCRLPCYKAMDAIWWYGAYDAPWWAFWSFPGSRLAKYMIIIIIVMTVNMLSRPDNVNRALPGWSFRCSIVLLWPEFLFCLRICCTTRRMKCYA